IDVSKTEMDLNEEIRRRNPNAISLTELNKYKFQWEKAIAQHKQAINDNYVAKLTAKTKAAQVEATAVDIDLKQDKAPFKGQVNEVFKKQGEWVQAGDAIIHLVGMDHLRVNGFVEADKAAPHEIIGKPVTITIYAAGNKQYTL